MNMTKHFILSSYLQASKTFSIYADIFKLLKVDHEYLPMEIRTIDRSNVNGTERAIVSDFFKLFKTDPSMHSIVISNPFKQVVPNLCDILDPTAERLQTVNLVLKDSKGRVVGKNIDGDAFLLGFKETIRYKIAGKNALLLGSGGVSTAVAFTLAAEDISCLFLYDIDSKKTIVLRNKLNHYFPKLSVIVLNDINDFDFSSIDLVYNGTGVGKKGHNPSSINESPVRETINLNSNVLAIDANYTPFETKFLQLSRMQGCRTINGFPHMLAFTKIHIYEILGCNLRFDKLKSIGEKYL